MALKMRQSLAQIEQEFRTEVQRDRHRREDLRRAAAKRSRRRGIEREKKKSSVRFWLLAVSLIATAAIVTVAMFESLYALLG
jgi:Flp pilus assembly protein TadB